VCCSLNIACAQLEPWIDQQKIACELTFDRFSNVSYMNTACSASGCALSLVQALKSVITCQRQGLQTNTPSSVLPVAAAVDIIASYEYLCTVKAAGASAAQNTYCMEDTTSWRGAQPSCAQFTATGCCLSNFFAMAGASDPAPAVAAADSVRQTCGIDISAVQPCQPPGWSNVTFIGKFDVTSLLDVHAVAPSCM